MTTTDTKELEDVLYEFSLAKEMPDSGLIDDYVRRFPEYASALTEFAVQVVLDTLHGSDTEVVVPPALDDDQVVSLAMSRFQNRLYQEKQALDAAAAVENPFESLKRSELRGLAQDLRANTVFVMKLRDRQIQAETIKPSFCQIVADKLAVSAELLTAHFKAPAQLQRNTYFKTQGKPAVGDKQTFRQAVENAGLDSEQQAYLLTL